MDRNKPLLCPSADSQMPAAKAFGVVLGTRHRPEIAYLEETLPLDRLVEQLGEIEGPAHLLRLSATCARATCGQWEQGGCRLGRELSTKLPPVVDHLPRCAIRGSCRWFAENKAAACLRCPQVTTQVASTDAALGQIAADTFEQRQATADANRAAA